VCQTSSCASAGCHPWDIDNHSVALVIQNLEYLIIHNKIVALGEIGLDRAITIPIEKQILYFENQLALSEKHKLPVVLHCVKAWSDLLAIRKKRKTSLPWIFHGYNGNLQTAQQLIAQRCYLSFGEALLKTQKVQQVFAQIPMEWLFLETDNSDEKIENIYKKAADLRHICIDDLKENIYQNFKRVFEHACTNIG
jgi:TatD DNase family protein